MAGGEEQDGFGAYYREAPPRERPFWVRLGLWGVPSRGCAMACVWVCLLALVPLVCIPLMLTFVPGLFRIAAAVLFGGVGLAGASWYFLAVRWVDQNDRW